MSEFDTTIPPATIDTGATDWQVLQQNERGEASVTLAGRWWTVMKRTQPQVHVRVTREGTLSPVNSRLDWTLAHTTVDESVTGAMAGKIGDWSVTLDHIPAGGPYRIETMVGSAEMGMYSRRHGQAIHFLCAGDIWLIAGQSNAEGYGVSPIDDPSEIGVHEFSPARGWNLATFATRHHPWLAFAKLIRKHTSCPVGLIRTAVGGTPISRWNPCETGDLYNNMLAAVTRAGGKIRGVLWYQGESDAYPELHPVYKDRFARFVNGVRGAVGDPKLPIITVQLNRQINGEPSRARAWEAIQEYQRQLAREIDGVHVISVFESALCDSIHNGSLGNLLIAQRAADTALGAAYGHDLPFRHPDCVRAVRTSPTTVELHFENVEAQLDYVSRPDHDFAFAVRDASGGVPVASFKIPARDRIVLELTRLLTGDATVTGMPGAHCSHNVPRDLSGQRGMLAFTHAITGQ